MSPARAATLSADYNSRRSCRSCGGRLSPEENEPKAWPCAYRDCDKGYCVCDWCYVKHTAQKHDVQEILPPYWLA